MSSLRRYGPPPEVVCLDEIKKRLKSFTCSSATYDFNSLFLNLKFYFSFPDIVARLERTPLCVVCKGKSKQENSNFTLVVC